MKKLFAFLIFLFTAQAFAQNLPEEVRKAAMGMEQKYSALSIAPSDLAIPARWPVPHSLPAVENLLEDPARGPAKISGWTEEFLKSKTPASTFKLSDELLGPSNPDAFIPSGADPVSRIMDAIREAYIHLAASYTNLSVKERNDA